MGYVTFKRYSERRLAAINSQIETFNSRIQELTMKSKITANEADYILHLREDLKKLRTDRKNMEKRLENYK
jgi:hypothetical protein